MVMQDGKHVMSPVITVMTRNLARYARYNTKKKNPAEINSSRFVSNLRVGNLREEKSAGKTQCNKKDPATSFWSRCR
jgi:hypothetical protein